MKRLKDAGSNQPRRVTARWTRIVDGLVRCFVVSGGTFRVVSNGNDGGVRSAIPRSSTDDTMMKLFSGHIDVGTCEPEAETLESKLIVRAAVLLTLMFE